MHSEEKKNTGNVLFKTLIYYHYYGDVLKL